MIGKQQIIEWLADQNDGQYDPDMDSDLVRIKAAELETLEKSSWDKIVLKFADEGPDCLEHRTIHKKALDWHSCAVGESLKNIAGVQDAVESTVIDSGHEHLQSLGQNFTNEIRDCEFDEAGNTLAQIQAYVRNSQESLRETEHRILDSTACAF